jgi:type I restriction-modification system DNA methylase subunit
VPGSPRGRNHDRITQQQLESYLWGAAVLLRGTIDAVDAVTREQAQSFLTDEQIEHIVGAYRTFREEAGFACVARVEEVLACDGNLSIPLYVPATSVNGSDGGEETHPGIAGILSTWLDSSSTVRQALESLIPEYSAEESHTQRGQR